ncbi:phage portal protein [Actinoplanes sp. NPDC051861]|uniref:phage portal protein n=1 Tax=Actinoplanes sp. NPDC051861 TaxID=3155170 RepID=UPI003431C2C9
MPIPTGGTWPPPEFVPAYQAYRDWDAWYDGSADKLRDVYRWRDSSGQSLPPSQRARAGQYAGGVIGAVSRWLWGSPPPVGARDGRLHIPLPADLARTAADLIFSEPPAITSENKAVQERLEQLEEDGLHTLLLHAAEAASALGDVYLRPVRDPEVYADRAFLATVHADGAIPTIRWGRLVEVTFWSVLATDGSKVVRLLEHHEPGRIVHAVHEGTQEKLGRPVPLTEYTASAHLADLVDADGAEETRLGRLDVVRIPNAGPQRKWRTIAGLKYLGRSDFDGNEPIFDNFDETWTLWMRDVRLAKGRIVVPEYMLQSNGRGQGATFDADREVWAAVNASPGKDPNLGQQLSANQFDIRWEAHKATAESLFEQALRHAGLSSQTLGEEGDIAATATEVQARERMSFTTRGNRISGAWRPGIPQAIELLLEYENAWNLAAAVEPERPAVEFPDGVQDGPETIARTIQLLDAATAISIETKVRMRSPDLDDTQVAEEVKRIKDDQGAGLDPELSLGGLAGNKPPGDKAENEVDPEE